MIMPTLLMDGLQNCALDPYIQQQHYDYFSNRIILQPNCIAAIQVIQILLNA